MAQSSTGELAALDENGRPRLGLLQNHRTNHAPIVYFPFDILSHRSDDLTQMTLDKRRVVLNQVCPQSEFVLPSAVMDCRDGSALRHNTRPRRCGRETCRQFLRAGPPDWYVAKMRVNLGQEFVVGGFIPSELGVDSLVVGFYEGGKLWYAGRVRAGLIPVTRRQMARELKEFIAEACPFCNLPRSGPGQWGEGLTKEKMAKVI